MYEVLSFVSNWKYQGKKMVKKSVLHKNLYADAS